jgi:hypothetical protein
VKTLVNVLLGLALVGVVVAIVLFFRTRGDEEAASKKPAPAVTTKVPQMSTDGVTASIAKRLEGNSRIPLTVRCPKRADDVVGNTFRCSVRREGSDRRIAIAKVEVTGPGGQYEWTSTPFEDEDAS